MLAVPPLIPCCFSFTTRTITHHHHHSISKRFNLLTVSANFQRKKNSRSRNLSPRNYDFDEEDEEEEEEEVGGIGHALMKSLKSDNPPGIIDAIQKDPKPISHRSTRNTKWVSKEEEEEEEGEKVELSGMDVLMALSRAKTQKPTRRRKKGSSDMKVSGHGKEEDNDDSVMDYKDVKPLNVKSDWGTRLEECEKSLQQLLLHQKF